MQFTPATCRALFAISISWPLSIAHAATADKTWTSHQDRCSIALPAGDWQKKKSTDPYVKLIYFKQGASKVITLAVLDAQGMTVLSRPGFDEGYLKATNATKIKGGDLAMEGRTAYRLVAKTALPNGKSVSHLVVAVISHGRVYRLSAQSGVTDTDIDSELNASINSFHLFDPPDAAPSATGMQPPKDDWVTWISENVGGYSLILLIGALIAYFVRKT